MTSLKPLQVNSNSTHALWLCAWWCFTLMQHVSADAQEQSQPPPPASTQGDQTHDLTEGLLELLNEPAAKPAPAASAREKPGATSGDKQDSPSVQDRQGSLPQNENAGAAEPDPRLTGEDLGIPRANPLAEVKLGMATAADWLRSRSRIVETQTLQNDIVARLDQLIGDLEQRPPQGNASSNAASPNIAASSDISRDRAGTQQPTPAAMDRPQRSAQASPTGQAPGQDSETASDATSATASGQKPRPSSTAGENGDGAPGPNGSPASGALQNRNASVQLNDPTALQRSAWGQLPDRVREQMQSRMVERFLPRYREEIEAYYRALAK